MITLNELYFIGFTILVLISYIIVRTTSKGRERFTDCSAIMVIGLLIEQISALYFGIQFENLVIFYMNTTIVFSPAIVLMSIDLIRQYFTLPEKQQKHITIDIE